MLVQRKQGWFWNIVTRKINRLKMRKQRNQCNALFGMPSAWGVVVRIGMNVRVDNRCPTDNMIMRKKTTPRIVTHKERYEKARYDLPPFSHKKQCKYT